MDGIQFRNRVESPTGNSEEREDAVAGSRADSVFGVSRIDRQREDGGETPP